MSSAELSQVVLERLATHARRRGSGLALGHKVRGRWRGLDWRAVLDEVDALAHGLAELGVRDGDEVLFVSRVRPRTLLAGLAVQALGATPVAVDVAQPADVQLAERIDRRLATSDARFAFADEGPNLEQLLASDARGVLEVVIHDDPRGNHAAADPRLRTYADLRADGERRRADGAPRPAPAGPATTADADAPPGLWSALAATQAASVSAGEPATVAGAAERLVALEPLASASTRALLARWLSTGAPLALPETDGDAEGDRREVAPTTLIASAAWLERLWLETEARLPAPGTLSRRLVDRALDRALDGGVEAPLARLIVIGPLARNLGLDRVRSAVVVGEPLAPAARRLLAALGVLPGPAASPPAPSNPLTSVEARTAA